MAPKERTVCVCMCEKVTFSLKPFAAAMFPCTWWKLFKTFLSISPRTLVHVTWYSLGLRSSPQRTVYASKDKRAVLNSLSLPPHSESGHARAFVCELNNVRDNWRSLSWILLTLCTFLFHIIPSFTPLIITPLPARSILIWRGGCHIQPTG